MRVLWLTPGFAADENDHNCIPPLQLLAQELLRQGVDLQIIALEYPFRSEPYRWHGATVFPCNGQNRSWLKPRTLWRAAETFRKLTTFGKFDALHSFWLGWASRVGEKISRRRNIPHFTTLMGQDVLPHRYAPLWRACPGLSGGVGGRKNDRAARLVAVSDFQDEIFEKNTGLRAGQVILWGVDESEIPAALPAERPLDVLGVGSLVQVKNWREWLKVIALAAQKLPGIQAELIGDGPERGELERLARQLNLEGKVRFAGNLPRAEVLARMRQTKTLLHTARFESFGYVLVEAAMSGCRVLGTPVGAMSEFGKTAKSEADLAALLLDELRQEVQKQAFVPFSMKETAAAYLRLYSGGLR